MDDKPCCPTSAARKVRQLDIDGTAVGITRLDEIMSEVGGAGLVNDEQISEELLRRIMIFNYVPQSAQAIYKAALLAEYKRRFPKR